MLERLIAAVRGSRSGSGRVDALLLRWAGMSVGVLGAVVLMESQGWLLPLHDQQIIMLANHPIYLSAEDANVSLMSPGLTFGVSVLLTLYLAAVLLVQPRLGRRNHVCLLAAVAVALPGLIGVLWHGVLYVAQPLMCVVLLWVVMVPLTLIRRLFS